MFRVEEIPFWLWIMFTLIYSCIGNPADNTWSGAYFIMNYIVLFWAFVVPKTKRIKIAGICMSVSLLIFCLIKFFIYPEIERFCIFLLFLISLCLNIYLQIRKK